MYVIYNYIYIYIKRIGYTQKNKKQIRVMQCLPGEITKSYSISNNPSLVFLYQMFSMFSMCCFVFYETIDFYINLTCFNISYSKVNRNIYIYFHFISITFMLFQLCKIYTFLLMMHCFVSLFYFVYLLGYNNDRVFCCWFILFNLY